MEWEHYSCVFTGLLVCVKIITLSIFCSKYLQINISLVALKPKKIIGALLKRIPNGLRIPNPELLGFGI
jgi:hypothetical protein